MFYNYDINKEAWDKKFWQEYSSNRLFPTTNALGLTTIKKLQDVFKTFEEFKLYRINILKEHKTPKP